MYKVVKTEVVMIKTRIVVVQMKQIIKTAIFVIIGLILIIGLIILILPNNPSNNQISHTGAFIPGIYSSYIVLHNHPIRVAVRVDYDRILDISLSDMNEIQEVFYPLFRPTLASISEQVVRYQTTQIDIPIEIQHTGRILLNAVDNAIFQAQNAIDGE